MFIKKILTFMLLAILPFQLVACSENTKIDTTKKITIKDFENLGFIYSENFPQEYQKNISYKLTNNKGASIYVLKDLTTMFYQLPYCEDLVPVTIANEDANDYTKIGNGVIMSETGIQNLYHIASFISKNPYTSFSKSFPNEMEELIEKNDLKALISHKGEDATGKWGKKSKGIWNITISSPNYFYYSSQKDGDESDTSEKNIILTFHTGETEQALLIKENAVDIIGQEALKASPEFSQLYEDLKTEFSNPENSFDPETLSVKLNSTTIGAFKKVLPYLNMP